MHVTKRRMLLGVAGVLTALMISGPVAAGGTGNGTVDVNNVSFNPYGGLVNRSDGNERNILFFNSVGSTNVQGAFLYDEILEFNPNVGEALRRNNEELGRHP